MRQLHSDLWIVDTPLRFGGVEIGARMTIIRLPDRKLLLLSPVEATRELVREVEALGEVAHLVAPNRFHHLFLGAWQEACPAALSYAAPELDSKRPDLKIDRVLSDEAEPAWSGTLDQVFVGGFPLVNEVVFFHRPSATLIATDLAFNIGADAPWLTRLAFRLSGSYGSLSSTLLERLFVRDRATFRRALEEILQWPFERVVVAHGDVCESGGRAELERGYAWILKSGRS